MVEWRKSSVFSGMGASHWKVRIDKGSHSGDKSVLQLVLGNKVPGRVVGRRIDVVAKPVSTR